MIEVAVVAVFVFAVVKPSRLWVVQRIAIVAAEIAVAVVRCCCCYE